MSVTRVARGPHYSLPGPWATHCLQARTDRRRVSLAGHPSTRFPAL